MSDSKEKIMWELLNGQVGDYCSYENRSYDFGLYTDLCGMSVEDALAAAMTCCCGGNGSGSGSTTAKTKNTIVFQTVGNETDGYKVVLSLTSAPTSDVTVSFKLDGETKSAVIPAGVASFTTDFELDTKYASISNIAITSEDTAYNYVYTNSVRDGMFTITYKVDGNVYQTKSLKYKSAIIAIAEPEKTGYTFTGWNPELPSTMGETNLNVSATFSINTYHLYYFVDGALYETKDIVYNGNVTPIELPDAADGYHYTAWSGVPSKMGAGDVTATTTSVHTVYKLVFKYDGKTESSDKYYNDVITYPTESGKTGYDFAWDYSGTTMPLSNLTINGAYTKHPYTLKFTLEDTEKPIDETYTKYYGDVITYMLSQKNGYDIEWNYTGTTMPASDLTVIGIYKPKVYDIYLNGAKIASKEFNSTIDFTNVNGVNCVETLSTAAETGKELTYVKVETESYDINDLRPYTVSGDVYITGIYDFKKFTVEFKDASGNTVQSSVLAYGSIPSYTGATLTKAEDDTYTYEFTGWTPAISEVTANAVYIPVFKETYKNYKVTFVNDDNTVITTKNDYHFGDTIVYPTNNPTKASTAEFEYTFNVWNKTPDTVNGDVTIKATYTESRRSYTIKFVNGAEVLQSGNVEYGVTPSYVGIEPTKAADNTYTYAFSGWSPAIVSVIGEATYEAQFSETFIEYTVEYRDTDDTVLDTQSLHYGDAISYKGATTIDELNAKHDTIEKDYTFAGWDNTATAVTGNTVIYATYSNVNQKYQIKFINGSNTVQDSMVDYGTLPEYAGASLNHEDESYIYTFNGWDPEVVTASTAANYSATFETVKRAYELTFKSDDNVLTGVTIEWGTELASYMDSAKGKVSDYEEKGVTYTFDSWVPNGDAAIPADGLMPKFDLILDAHFVEKQASTKLIYGIIPTSDADNFAQVSQLTASGITDYSNGKDVSLTYTFPLYEDYVDETENLDEDELAEWEDAHRYNYILLIPSDVTTVVVKNELGLVLSNKITKTTRKITVDGSEYDIYTGVGASQTDEVLTYTYKINVTK